MLQKVVTGFFGIAIGISFLLLALAPDSSLANTLLSLPDTIIVEMYELRDDGSNTEKPCTDLNKTQYGCTALVDNSDFAYPYSSSTPDVPLEEYVLDVISTEMNPNIWTELAALKAQAAASLSYAVWHGNNNQPLNNSAVKQVFAPFTFEWLVTADGSTPTQQQTCASSNLTAGQQRACIAVADRHYIAQAADNPNNYPARAAFLQDMYAESDDATFDKPYYVGVPDPVSTACDAKDIVTPPTLSIGMSSRGANRWARGH